MVGPSALLLLAVERFALGLVTVATALVETEVSPVGAKIVYALVQLELLAPFPILKDVLNPKLVFDAACPVFADPPEFVIIAVAKNVAYDEFQADTDARTLDGTGAMVAWAEEHSEESADAALR